MNRLVSLLLILGVLFFSCKEKNTTQNIDKNAAAAVLDFPHPPADLNQDEALDFVLMHFWDALDVNDTAQTRNRDFIEQNFANFTVFLSASADTLSRKNSVRHLMKNLEKDSMAYHLMAKTAYHYLYDPQSPMLSEESFIPFMEVLMESHLISDSDKVRLDFLLENAYKNRPGMKAADFRYITRQGSVATLLNTPSKGNILLMFYDPDCENCKAVIENMKANDILREMIAKGEITVLAIYSGSEKAIWQKQAGELPKEWVVGYEPGVIDEDELYYWRATPTFYLLSPDKDVILKDPPFSMITG